MRKAVIFGSVGINRGDDLMNRVLVNACKRCGYDPIVASLNPEFIRKTYNQSSFSSSKKSVGRWIKEVSRSDCVIVGGGTLVQDDFGHSKLSGILLYAVVAVLISKIFFRKPTYVLGLGVNKVNGINGLLAKFLLFADVILVRDQASVDNSQQLGIGRKVKKLFDVGLCKSLYDDPLAISASLKSSAASKSYICVSLAKEGHGQKAMLVAQVAIDFAIENGHAVKLVAMDSRESEELSLYSQLVLDNKGVDISIVVSDTPYHIAEVVKGAVACIGMRLHFCVLCLVSGVSPLVVSREQKSEWIKLFVGEDRIVQLLDPCLPQKIWAGLNDKDRQILDLDVVEELRQIDFLIERALSEIICGHEVK